MEQPQVPEKPIVRWRGGNYYTVSSRTRPGLVHHINTFDLTCSCEAGRWGKRCWGLRLALIFEDYRKNELRKGDASTTRS